MHHSSLLSDEVFTSRIQPMTRVRGLDSPARAGQMQMSTRARLVSKFESGDIVTVLLPGTDGLSAFLVAFTIWTKISTSHQFLTTCRLE